MSKVRAAWGIAACLFVIVGCLSKMLYDKKMEDGYQKYVHSEDHCISCLFVDEEAGTSEPWHDTDPEFKGLTKDDSGLFQPLKDKNGKIIKDVPGGYPGTRSLHIPMIRGFANADIYGMEKCRPCRDAKTEIEIDACNNRQAYMALFADVPEGSKPKVEDLDGAHPKEEPMRGQ